VIVVVGTSDPAAADASWVESGWLVAGVDAALDDGLRLDDGCLLLDDAVWVVAACVDAG